MEKIRKNITFPLSIKIFTLTLALVFVAIGVIAWQNGRLIYSLLTKNFQIYSINSGERLSGEVEKFVLRLDHDLYRSIQSVLLQNDPSYSQRSYDLTRNNENVVGIDIIREMNGRFDLIRNANKSVLMRPVQQDFSWLAKRIKKNPGSFSHFAPINEQHHGKSARLIAMARRFKVQDVAATFWGIAYVKVDAMEHMFGSAETVQIGLATRNLDLLAGNFPRSQDWEDIKVQSNFRNTLDFGVSSAYLGESRDPRGVSWLGSFVLLPEYDLVLFIRQEASAVYGRIYHLLYGTALWSFLIFLIALAASYLSARTITHKLSMVIHATQKIASGDFNLKIAVKSRDEVGHLVSSVNWMAGKIGELLDVEKEKVRFEQEINTAQMVQDSFFSPRDYDGPNLKISGYHNPSSECCGDWWSYVRYRNGIEQVFIGDATGHGAGAALVTAVAYTTIKSLMEIDEGANTPPRSPSAILDLLNRIIFDTLRGSMYMTFLVLQFDPKSRQVTYSNAGHCFPILLPRLPENDDRLDVASRQRRQKSMVGRKRNVTLLGADRQACFVDETLPIRSGDRIFLYTDGAFEFVTNKGRRYGVRNLQKAIQSLIQLDLKEFRDKLSSTLEEERAKGIAEDDMTFVAVEVS